MTGMGRDCELGQALDSCRSNDWRVAGTSRSRPSQTTDIGLPSTDALKVCRVLLISAAYPKASTMSHSATNASRS